MSSLDGPNAMKKLFPAAADYSLAVTHLDRFVFVQDLAGGRPRTYRSSVGNPDELECYSGGYSRVYPIQVGNKTWALRCWIKYPGNVKDRWQKARDYLFWTASSYFVPFNYVDDGILVNGKRFSVSYMEWVEGDTLAGFLDKYIGQSAIILQLADKFLSMVRELHKGKISHGDLQDGNLMVRIGADDQVEIKLIDYDSIFVPGLEYLNSNGIPGVPNYQHPNRSGWSQMNERADYFSELVIYLSLRAYAERPDLWRRGQEQELLFTSEDFQDPAGSITFSRLATLSPEINRLAHHLWQFCVTNTADDLMPLEFALEKAPVLHEIRPVVGPPPSPQPMKTEPPPMLPLPPRSEQPIPPRPNYWLGVALVCILCGILGMVAIVSKFGPASRPVQAPAQTRIIKSAPPSASPAPSATVKHDPSKDSALIEAAQNGNVAEVKRLLSEGANVNAKTSYEQTALHRAAILGDTTVVQLLVNRGSDISATDKEGATALLLAASCGHTATVQVFLDRGAHINAADRKGVTALQAAASNNNAATVKLLLDRGLT